MNLAELLDALNCSPLARIRDGCGDWYIKGKAGAVYHWPDGIFLWCDPGSPRAWGFVKKALAFCRVVQDGDDEGFLFIDRMPTPDEAVVIRDKLGIRKKREMSEQALAVLREASVKGRFYAPGDKRAVQPPRLTEGE